MAASTSWVEEVTSNRMPGPAFLKTDSVYLASGTLIPFHKLENTLTSYLDLVGDISNVTLELRGNGGYQLGLGS